MKRIKDFWGKPLLTWFLLILSVVSPVIYYAARATWVFVDIMVDMESFTFGLLYVMILNCVVLGVLLFIRLKNEAVCNKKAFKIICITEYVVTLLIFIVALVFAMSSGRGEAKEGYLLYLKKSLVNAFFFGTVPILALFLGFIKDKARKGVVAVALAVTLVIVAFNLFPLTPFRLTSHPMVIDTGRDYSVVFSTNEYGTGFVEYSYGGKNYKIFDESGGRLKSDSKIHSINIPYEHLENNTYKIGSQRVMEQYSYGSHTGKAITSEVYKFTPVKKDNMRCLVISDWHTYTELAFDAISHGGDYDAIILLGDATPGVDFEEQVVSNVVNFASELSKGAKPVIYARGNHETRGEYAGKILDALGLEEFYYTADMGGVSFVVLDSGEDKVDTHPEYGGMTEYKKYREAMLEWLKTVEINSDRVVALCHSWAISDIEEELSLAGWGELDRLGTRLIMSGHLHQCRFLGTGDEKEKAMTQTYPDLSGYIVGGHSDGEYVASFVTFGKNDIFIEAIDNSGKKVFNEYVTW